MNSETQQLQKIQELAALFPRVDNSVIRGILEIKEWDTRECIDPLLDIAESIEQSEKKEKESKQRAPTTSERLGEEYERLCEAIRNLEEKEKQLLARDVEPKEVRLVAEERDTLTNVRDVEKIDESFVVLKDSNVVPKNEEIKAKLEERDQELNSLREQLEQKCITEPSKVQIALTELKNSFKQLKDGSKVNLDKAMIQMKNVLDIIDRTLLMIKVKAARFAIDLKNEVQTWKILETLLAFTKSFKQDVKSAMSGISKKLTQPETTPEEKEDHEAKLQQLEEYLAELQKQSERVTEEIHEQKPIA